MTKPIVLVVEDEALIAFAISDALEQQGFAVAGPFPDSQSALQSITSSMPDCGLLDFNLGQGDDCRRIAVELGKAKVPFLVLSSYSRSLLDDSMEAKPAAWIRKPVDFDRVAHVVRDKLNAAQATGQR